jgi:DNA polymerase (family 10)
MGKKKYPKYKKLNLPLSEAERYANQFLQAIRPAINRGAVAGSIRRKTLMVGDLDFVVVTSSPENLREHLARMQIKWGYDFAIRGGEKKIFLRIPFPFNWGMWHKPARGGGVRAHKKVITYAPVNIWITTHASWGATLMEATGPKGYNIGLRKRAKGMGMKLNAYGLFRGVGGDQWVVVAARTEREIYKALGKPYKKPELRGIVVPKK